MAQNLNNSNIKRVGVQSDVISPPLDNNFQALKDKQNEALAEINALSTAASGAEISQGRPYHASLKARLDSIGQISVLKDGGAVSERNTPVMSVKVSALAATVNGTDIRMGFCTWTRVGTVITATEPGHQRSNGQTVDVEVRSDINNLPLGEQSITGVSGDTYLLVGVDTGAASGTCEVATVMGAVSAPGSNTRLDYVVATSSNTVSILTGSSAVDPVFPTVATTQLVIGCLIVKVATTELNDNVEIFILLEGDRNMPDHYIGTTLDLPQGTYNFNNLIIDAQIDLDFVQTGDITDLIGYAKAKILCEGNFITTTTGVIIQKSGSDPASSNCSAKDGDTGQDGSGGGAAGGAVGVKIQTDKQNLNGGHSGKGGDPTGAGSGAGGGGGGAIFAAGGVGGAAIAGSFGGTGQAAVTSGVGLLIKAQNIKMLGAITLSGKDGVDDGGAGGGASGGSGAGCLILIAIKDIDINMTFTSIGGDGGDAVDGGAGGGGAGGSIFLYYLTITDNLTTSFAAGSGGTSTNAGNGVAGNIGIKFLKEYDDVSTALKNNRFDWEAF